MESSHNFSRERRDSLIVSILSAILRDGDGDEDVGQVHSRERFPHHFPSSFPVWLVFLIIIRHADCMLLQSIFFFERERVCQTVFVIQNNFTLLSFLSPSKLIFWRGWFASSLLMS